MNIVIGNLQPSPERAPTVGWRDASRQPLLKQGAVFTATLVERTDDYARLATAEGAGFTAKSDSVKGEVGDLLSFEVVKSGKRLTLRQIAARDDSRASLRKDAPPIDELIESKKTIDKIKDEDVRFAEEKQEEQEKIAKAIAIITRAQSYVESNAGKSAAAAIVESGLSVSKIGFATLERVMRESGNVKTPELSEDEIIKSGVDRGIARSLLGRGLPAVSKNAELLEKVFDRIPPGLPDASVARLVAEGNPITLEKIYVGRYASPDGRFAGSVEPEPGDGDLEWQIKRYFAGNGIEETRSNIEAARLLVKNDLPLDGGNVELAEILRNLRAHVSKEAAY
ncbi:MAG: hypothetical protein FWF03_00165, partial [Defluviitaleaceae bacterium]|nr:hypothetical protein [Defluviitaleaceae bacterium]